MGDQPLRQWDSAIETGRLTHGAKSGCFRPIAVVESSLVHPRIDGLS